MRNWFSPRRHQIAKAPAEDHGIVDLSSLDALARAGIVTFTKLQKSDKRADDDDRPTSFLQALRQQGSGWPGPNVLERIKAKPATPVKIEKGAFYQGAVKRGRYEADREVGQQTGDLIQRVTAAVSAQVFEKLNETLDGMLAAKIQKAEAERTPTWQEQHEAQVRERRNELAEIDLQIASHKSGMLDVLVDDTIAGAATTLSGDHFVASDAPRQVRKLSKAEQEADDRLQRLQMGLRPTTERLDYQ